MTQAVECAYSDHGGHGGDPEASEALILVHGIGARRSLWNAAIAQLKERYRCISYDLRGHGESPWPGEPFTLDDLVADLEALRVRLGLERMHIVGHSLGGMIGPAYARRYPQRVRSLGLLSTAAFRTADDAARVQALVAAMRAGGVAASLEVLVARWFTEAFGTAQPEAIRQRRQQVLDTNPEVFLNVFEIYAKTEMAAWLPSVSAPTLVLTGEFDGGCPPRLNQQIAAALPHARLVVLEALKHAVLIEAPEQVAQQVMAFLAEVSNPSEATS
ncbi:alpha/beta fold hydrolase [Paraburkholderia bonniea]|uniref:alpha/beta fold hydrolase n=1 Tax=Paraburkholderia bonniea TaxID=2152891 RepID=UPI0012921303|nr:alpha/beta fold hydrolase [Paraburkholderia bonniea]WJF90866.1 alpha/beta fold hydrolase [Paraburkholderia bonniea]WJF94180.1 alpha/beta fold hydrolase [Paraburkholderia bonniea]